MMKLLFGVGINDADYAVQPKVNGTAVRCPYYVAWTLMLQRAYHRQSMIRNPCYEGVTVCDEWLRFTNFKNWMEAQDWKGKELDKDIIEPGNKTYGPDRCVYVEPAVNSLLTKSTSSRGDFPIGVTKKKKSGRYKARVSKGGPYSETIGTFDTVEEASEAYNKAKSEYILEVAACQTDKRIVEGLRLHAQLYREGNYNA